MIDAPPPPHAAITPVSPAFTKAVVAPRRAFFGARPVALRLRFSSPGGAADLRVEIRRRPGGALGKRWVIKAATPPGPLRLRWNGRAPSGRAARDGRYVVSGGPDGGLMKRLGILTLHGHVYPVRGPHGFRGGVGLFGAGRNGGRTHEGFDILSACGTPVVAARAGVVTRRYYDPVLYGNNVIVRGAGQRREYWYSHLRTPGRVRVGQRVSTGRRLGEVGQTGNARTTPCHLHFEMRGAGGPFDPLPSLRVWDAYS